MFIPANATNSSAFAVMLCIHGGGFISGDTTLYEGGLLETEGDVIVVVAAYRLGAL